MVLQNLLLPHALVHGRPEVILEGPLLLTDASGEVVVLSEHVVGAVIGILYFGHDLGLILFPVLNLVELTNDFGMSQKLGEDTELVISGTGHTGLNIVRGAGETGLGPTCVGHETIVECQGDAHLILVIEGSTDLAKGGKSLLTAGVVEGGLDDAVHLFQLLVHQGRAAGQQQQGIQRD